LHRRHWYRCAARLWIRMFPPPTTPRSEQSGLWQNWRCGSMRILQ
jgi:hypothetical protein